MHCFFICMICLFFFHYMWFFKYSLVNGSHSDRYFRENILWSVSIILSFHFIICLHKDFLSQSYMWLTLFLFFFGFGPGCYIHIIIPDGCFFKLHCEYKETGSLMYLVQLYQQQQLNVFFLNKVYIDKIMAYVIKELHTLWKLKYFLLLCTPSASPIV